MAIFEAVFRAVSKRIVLAIHKEQGEKATEKSLKNEVNKFKTDSYYKYKNNFTIFA